MSQGQFLRLTVFKWFRAHVGAMQQPRDAVAVADSLGIDVEQVRPVLAWLRVSGKICCVGGCQSKGLLYSFVDGATPPEDRRGRHQKQLNGRRWAASRKMRKQLAGARLRRVRKARREAC